MADYTGIHPETATIKQVLALQGVKNPHTGEPFTEAMLLGIGGGLGAGYILWEFKAHESADVVMGFRSRWNYVAEFMQKVPHRLSAETVLQEASRRKAGDNLQAWIAQGKPFIAWVDKAHLPHHGLPESMQGYRPHQVTIIGAEGNNIIMADLAEKLYSVPADIFADGRDRIGSDKNRLLFIKPPVSMDLTAAIKAGITDQIDHLSRDSESFSLPVYQKWAKLMTHPKDKKAGKSFLRSATGCIPRCAASTKALRWMARKAPGCANCMPIF